MRKYLSVSFILTVGMNLFVIGCSDPKIYYIPEYVVSVISDAIENKDAPTIVSYMSRRMIGEYADMLRNKQDSSEIREMGLGEYDFKLSDEKLIERAISKILINNKIESHKIILEFASDKLKDAGHCLNIRTCSDPNDHYRSILELKTRYNPIWVAKIYCVSEKGDNTDWKMDNFTLDMSGDDSHSEQAK